MGEGTGAKAAGRSGDDALMGVFGTPNEDVDLTQAFTSAAAANTSLRAEKWYRFIATQDCHVRFSAAGSATTSNMLLKAGIPEIFYSGPFTRISVIRDAVDGTLYITEIQTAPRSA